MGENHIIALVCIGLFITVTFGKCIFNSKVFKKEEKLDTTWTITVMYFVFGVYLLMTKHTILDDGGIIKLYITGLVFVVGFHIVQRSINSIFDKVGSTKIKYKELEIEHASSQEQESE